MNTIIILPAYNVASRIPHILEGLLQYKERTIIIDDGSVDETSNIVKKCGFKCIHNEKNLGVSDAIRKGLIYAKNYLYDSAIILDSDGQHNPNSIPEFEYLLTDNDLVVGNRFHSIDYIPSGKLISNAIAVIMFDALFGCALKDITCGYRAFHLDKWIYDVIEHSHRYSFIFDILAQALLQKKIVTSVNIECIYHNEEFQYTKTLEIISFISCLQQYGLIKKSLEQKVSCLYNDVICHRDFSFEIHRLSFYGFYIEKYDGYIIQTDLEKLHSYWKAM